MFNLLINILILVIVGVVVFLVAKWLMGEAEIGDPIRKIILLILFLVFIILLIAVVSGQRVAVV